jgi:hypothetical protein
VVTRRVRRGLKRKLKLYSQNQTSQGWRKKEGKGKTEGKENQYVMVWHFTAGWQLYIRGRPSSQQRKADTCLHLKDY